MNERIKELFQKSCWDEQAQIEIEDFIDVQKFAEMIVKECAALTLDYKNDQHYNGWLDYRHQIREHFGVEE